MMFPGLYFQQLYVVAELFYKILQLWLVAVQLFFFLNYNDANPINLWISILYHSNPLSKIISTNRFVVISLHICILKSNITVDASVRHFLSIDNNILSVK